MSIINGSFLFLCFFLFFSFFYKKDCYCKKGKITKKVNDMHSFKSVFGIPYFVFDTYLLKKTTLSASPSFPFFPLFLLLKPVFLCFCSFSFFLNSLVCISNKFLLFSLFCCVFFLVRLFEKKKDSFLCFVVFFLVKIFNKQIFSCSCYKQSFFVVPFF